MKRWIPTSSGRIPRFPRGSVYSDPVLIIVRERGCGYTGKKPKRRIGELVKECDYFRWTEIHSRGYDDLETKDVLYWRPIPPMPRRKP